MPVRPSPGSATPLGRVGSALRHPLPPTMQIYSGAWSTRSHLAWARYRRSYALQAREVFPPRFGRSSRGLRWTNWASAGARWGIGSESPPPPSATPPGAGDP